MDEGVKQARDAVAREFLRPDFIIQSVLGQFERFLADEPAKNVLEVLEQVVDDWIAASR